MTTASDNGQNFSATSWIIPKIFYFCKKFKETGKMIFNNETATDVAKYLLDIKAVKLNVSHPFTWASGIKSPIYCDNRKTLSYPEVRTFISKSMVKIIREKYPDVEVIAGVATGAIAVGMLVAQELQLPYVYVRSSKKDHGLQNKIEGNLEIGKKVVVIEDLISTGQSSLDAVRALREVQSKVLGMVAIYTYGLPVSISNFKSDDCELTTLTDYDITISTAAKTNYIMENEMETLKEWKKDPASWWKEC